jgi:hypothetical protein
LPEIVANEIICDLAPQMQLLRNTEVCPAHLTLALGERSFWRWAIPFGTPQDHTCSVMGLGLANAAVPGMMSGDDLG